MEARVQSFVQDGPGYLSPCVCVYPPHSKRFLFGALEVWFVISLYVQQQGKGKGGAGWMSCVFT